MLRSLAFCLVVILLGGCGAVFQEARQSTEKSGNAASTLSLKKQVRSEQAVLLDAAIQDLLIQRRFLCDEYGLATNNTIALYMDSVIPWPANYTPDVPGFHFVYRSRNDKPPEGDDPPQLCLDIDHFAWPPRFDAQGNRDKSDLFDGHAAIVIYIFNVGGEPSSGELIPSNGTCVCYGIAPGVKHLEIEYNGFLAQ